MNCTFSQKSLLQGSMWLALCLCLCLGYQARAEGTRQVAPAKTDSIVMLETNRPDFGNFAAYGGPADSRLVVTIDDPSEILYIGLSGEYNDAGRPFDLGRSRYRFRIVNASGTVVHGPFLIDNSNANLTGWEQSLFGNYDVSATQNGLPIYRFDPIVAGDYYIEFTEVLNDGNNKVNIAYWDFTVTRNNQPIPGRVWSKNWAFRTPPTNLEQLPDCEWDRPFSGVLYSYTTDGFVSRIDFSQSGFQGLSFNVAFNSTGPGISGNLEEDRMSVPGRNATATSAEHRIFLNEPDPIVFPDGECGFITSATTFSCTDGEGFCLEVSVSDPGQVEVVIDFNQNGVFDPESQDVSIVYNFPPDALSACVPWNGLRGDSSAVAFGDTVDLLFTYTRGVQHYAVYDAEFLKNGFCVETVRPICGDIEDNRLFWDDREIPQDSGTGQPKDGRGGCECGVDNCRTWTNFDINVGSCAERVDSLTTGYGDKNTLNTWWFASSSLVTRADIPLLSCMIVGEPTICNGVSTELTVQVSGSFDTFTYSWSGPNGFGSSDVSTGPITVAGEYCVTVTNPVGCERVCCVEVMLGDSPALSAVVTDATCEAAVDGVINATATGGQGTYQFSLNGGPFQETGVFAGLDAGDYELTVMDALGCTSSIPVTVGLLSEINIEYPDQLYVCFDGSSALSFNGDATGLSFSWEPAVGLDDPSSASPVFSPQVSTMYTVTIRRISAPECFVQQQVNVEVGPDIHPELSGVFSGCEPSTVLNAGSDVPATFTWLNSNGAVVGTGEQIELPLSGEMSYVLRAEDNAGCTQEVPFTLSGGPVDISLPDTLAACTGESLQLMAVNQDANDVLTYSWSPVEAFAGGTDTASPDYLEVVGANTVYVTITNQFGCEYVDSVQVAIIDADVAFDFEHELQCDGATVVFNNTSTNAFGFFWDFGDGTTSTEVNPAHVYSEGGTYTVQLTSVYDASCVSTRVKEIMVREPELVAGFTYDLTNCVPGGATIAFSDTSFISMGSITNWSWTFSDGQTSNEQNPTITFDQSGPLTVTLIVTSDNGCENVETQTIDIQIVEIELSEEESLCPGESIVLNPNGNPDYVYSWMPAEGLDDPGSASPVASPTQTTTYTVEVLNLAGTDTCAFTTQVVVFVRDPINLDLGPDLITCGEDAEITYTADVPVTVQWTSSSEGDLGSGASITINPLRRDTIFATAIDEFGCMDSDTLIVVDQGVDVVTEPLSPIVTCGNLDTTITIINQDMLDQLTYSWSPLESIVDGADGPTVTVSVESGNVTFQAIITNQFNCVDTVEVVVTAEPFDPNLPETVFVCAGNPTAINPDFEAGFTYQWSPAAGLDDPNAPNPVFTGDTTTVYDVLVVDSETGCSANAAVTVVVNPSLNLEAGGDTTLCTPGAVALTATAEGSELTFTWYDNPDLSGDPVGTGPEVTVTPSADTTLYTVVAGDNAGCTEEDTVIVILSPVLAEISPPQVFCEPTEGITIMVTNLNPTEQLTYQWSPAEATDPDEGPIVMVDPNISEDYSVTVTNEHGCETVLTTSVKVVDLSQLTISAEPTNICLGESTTITVSGCEDCEYTWTGPGTITPLDGPVVTVTPDVDGAVIYTVTVEKDGCMETLTIPIVVTELICTSEYFFLPNAFTPNGDNINDVLRVRSNFLDKITSFELQVYNRWGDLVFQTTNPFDGWDGTFKGRELPPDVYGFFMNVDCPTGEEVRTQGNVSLLK